MFALLARFGLPAALPEGQFFGMDTGVLGLLGSVIATLGIIVWWLFFSRAPWSDRLGAVVVMVVAVVATKAIAHPSIAGAGQGFLVYLMGIQLMSLALVLWAAASRGLSAGARRLSMAVVLFAACGLFAIIRTDGVSSSMLGSDYRWRWTPTAEELLLARASGRAGAAGACSSGTGGHDGASGRRARTGCSRGGCGQAGRGRQDFGWHDCRWHD